jgi:3-deoxy-D-arabino-heptulosonate 7-phosphate (DAHP) synthase
MSHANIHIPSSPTKEELHADHPLSLDTELAVLNQRARIAAALRGGSGLLAIIGPCARPSYDNQDVLLDESRRVQTLELLGDNFAATYRGPMHKPRTNPADYQGEEQVDPRGALVSMQEQADQDANVAVEVRCQEHLDRYGRMLSFMWTGGRNVRDNDLMRRVALHTPSMPVGVKNNIDGTIGGALTQAHQIEQMRSTLSDAAPVRMVYRGGKNAQNPRAWEEQYKHALALTRGNLIVDVAHGSEMAHDPKGAFNKTVAGQHRALEAVILLAEQGYTPAGIMIEASELPQTIDPHLPLDIALDGVKQLYQLKQRR